MDLKLGEADHTSKARVRVRVRVRVRFKDKSVVPCVPCRTHRNH